MCKHKPNQGKSINALPKQNGAALAVSLILLTALTILGVSVLQSSGLQERMAANSQEKLAAFQAAESGVTNAINSNADFSLEDDHAIRDDDIEADLYDGAIKRASYIASRCWLQETSPPRSAGRAEAQSSRLNHFDIMSLGRTAGTGGRVAIHQGVYILKRNAGVPEVVESEYVAQSDCMQQDPEVFNVY